ncbi:MAG: sugar transferase [Flavobacteriaceae bacterium]|nr:sugar transferase [Flavobacteriaceae bacterium]
MLKRLFDILASGFGILILSPILLILSLAISFGSRGGVFYRQERIGRYGKAFRIFKFRSMYTDSDKKGLLTVGDRDPRVTPIGYYLRKSKLDELPQLLNVFIGDMSLVGPRPEVERYVDLYSTEDKKVLRVRPGITDYASIHYRNETEILKAASDPEKKYIEEIMPAKLALNKKYIDEKSLYTDIKIIFATFKSIVEN